MKEKYEVHHGVRILDSALIAAAQLSDRYITDRFLPDKAIDLIDEACSKVRMQIDTMPEKLDEVTRKLLQLQIEKVSLKNDDSTSALKRKEEMDKEISSLAEKKKELEGLWQAQKAVNDRIKEDKKLLDKNNLLLEKYMQEANYLRFLI